MFTLYVPKPAPQTLNRTDALLAAILKELRGGGGVLGSRITGGGSANGTEWRVGSVLAANVSNPTVAQNPQRVGLLFAATAAAIHVWPVSGVSITVGLVLTANTTLELVAAREGALVGAAWYVAIPAGGVLSWIEIFA